jgi:hypothetical protein
LILIDRKDLVQKETNSAIQEDIVRRDQAFVQEDKRRRDGKRSSPTRQARPGPEAEISPVSVERDDKADLPRSDKITTTDQEEEGTRRTTWIPKLLGKRTWLADTKAAFQTMKAAFTGRPTPPYNPEPRETARKVTATLAIDQDCITVDIGIISAAGFVFNCQDPGVTIFSITLDEIDKAIAYKSQPVEATDVDLFARKLPAECKDLANVFSQANSDELPPHRTIDHKIVLEQENNLGFSPLYQMSLSELQTVKRYLLDNLDKGFIVPSQAPYASPVLFVKKPDGSLRFCIDY